MMKTKGFNNFAFYFVVLLFFAVTFFILSGNLEFFYAYGIDEKAIFFGRSLDISSNNGSSELPQISSQGNNVYVVWQDNSSGNYDIYFTHSSDNGNSFAQARSLSNNSGSSELPQISSQGNNVYVVWQDNTDGNYDIFFRPSTTNGANFKSIRDLSNNNGTSQIPQTVSYGSNVYVVWQDNTDGNYDIIFKRSPNNGTGFKSVNLVNTNGTSEHPQVAVHDDNVYVVWQDNSSGNYDIYFQPLISADTRFKSERNLSNNNGTSEFPDVAVLGNEIYVMWKDNDNGTDRIFFKHGQIDNSTGRIKFGSLNKLYHNGEVSQAKIASGSEFFYGVWASQLNKSNASTIEFYPFMLFEDYSGDAIPLTSLSSNEILSSPDIAIDKNYAYIVWESETTGNGNIYFKKLSTDFFERDG